MKQITPQDGLPKNSILEVFDVNGISIMIDEYRETFESIIALLLDKEIISLHIKRVEQFERDHYPSDYQEVIKAADKYSLDGMNFLSLIRNGRLENAIRIYSRQTIVIVVTLFEIMLFELFRCLFCNRPERLQDFISVEPNETILEGNIKELAANAAKKASQTSYRKELEPLIKKIEHTFECKTDKKIMKKVFPYIKIRNRIVHEGSDEKLTPKIVIEGFNTIMEILHHFEQIAKTTNIPTEYSYSDESP